MNAACGPGGETATASIESGAAAAACRGGQRRGGPAEPYEPAGKLPQILVPLVSRQTAEVVLELAEKYLSRSLRATEFHQDFPFPELPHSKQRRRFLRSLGEGLQVTCHLAARTRRPAGPRIHGFHGSRTTRFARAVLQRVRRAGKNFLRRWPRSVRDSVVAQRCIVLRLGPDMVRETAHSPQSIAPPSCSDPAPLAMGRNKSWNR
jgi:hypothetical protein